MHYYSLKVEIVITRPLSPISYTFVHSHIPILMQRHSLTCAFSCSKALMLPYVTICHHGSPYNSNLYGQLHLGANIIMNNASCYLTTMIVVHDSSQVIK